MSEEELTEEQLSEKEPGEDESGDEAPPLLEEQLAQAQAQAKEYLDGWQRARAELANFKKRVERERSQMYDAARIALIARFLEILDDFERALGNVPEGLDSDDWFEGLTLIQRKLIGLLEAEGVSEIEAEGQTFDPALHEAIAQEARDDHEEGQIIEVVQKGYMLGERVVRPARVRLAG